jgi:hypothetical protein
MVYFPSVPGAKADPKAITAAACAKPMRIADDRILINDEIYLPWV